MGASADAHLVYGYYVDCEESFWPSYDEETDEELPEWDVDEALEALLKEKGLVDPNDSYPPMDDLYGSALGDARAEWRRENKGAFEDWAAAREEKRKVVGADVVEVGWYGTLEYDVTTPYIYVKSSEVSGDWTDPAQVDIQALAKLDTDEFDAMLAKFIEFSGADISEATGPGWFIAVDYG